MDIRLMERFFHPSVLTAFLVVTALAIATLITYYGGGNTLVLPHLYYVPIVLGAVSFGVPGGVITGILAGILCGPWMPHSVVLGIPQTIQNWVARGVFFTAIGALIGAMAGRLRLRIADLEKLNEQTVLAFVRAVDAKDPYTAQHSERVARFARAIAMEMRLPMRDVKRIHAAALLHDIGKIAVPGSILNKPSQLSDEEFEIIKRHPIESVKIVSGIDQFREYLAGIRHHHERVDGKGYPDGVSGADFCLDARIIAVADAYEAMTSDRSYRPGMDVAEAIRRLRAGAGTQFDPDVVEALVRVLANPAAQETSGAHSAAAVEPSGAAVAASK